MKLILASSSPRRAEILRDAGIEFEVRPAHVEESPAPGETPEAMVARLAEQKALAIVRELGGNAGVCVVLGADTAVVADHELFGKPESANSARSMLQALSGRTHRVLTGICLIRIPDMARRTAIETTEVTFAPVTREEIDDYIRSGEPMDKAGGYAIQGRAGRYITRIDGCYFNVVGLPLARLYVLLGSLGWTSVLSG
jgi:nucleoside triphosphate pyrophosphatase